MSSFDSHPGNLTSTSVAAPRVSSTDRSVPGLLNDNAIYRAIGESINYGVWICAPDGRNLYVSESFLKLVGITQEQCSDYGWGEVLHPDDASRTIDAWKECVRTGGNWDMEHRFRGVDGQWHRLLARGVPVKDEAGRIHCWAGINLDLTERTKSDDALLESEERYRMLAETMLQGVVHQDATGQIIAMNPAAERILGKTRERFLGSTSTQEERDTIREDGTIFPGEEHPSVVALKTGREQRGVVMGVFNPQLKEYRWIRIDAVPVFRQGETKPVEVYAVFDDFTERKRANEKLRESENRFRHIADAAPVLIWMTDVVKQYAWFSRSWDEFTGRRMNDNGAHAWLELVHPEDLPRCKSTYEVCYQTRRPFELEYRLRHRSGRYHWLLAHGAPRLSESGSFLGFTGSCVDITERKHAESTLRQNEALFSTLIEQAPLGVYVVDQQFRLQQINSRALPVFASVRPLIGRDFGEVMHILWGTEVGGECSRIFRHTLATGERYISPPFVHDRHDLKVEQAYEWETQRITLPDGQHGVVCYFTDVTEQRRAEFALQEAKRAAETANASKDRFLAVLSHELRTPLTPVLMTVGALQHDPSLRSEVREDLAMIKRNIELETKLIDDLLDLSRITSGKVELKRETVDLNEAVRQVCTICRPQLLEKNIRLETTFCERTGSISADHARLQQVLWNVLKNAVKFTPDSGTVRVSTTRLAPDRCEIRVEDNGIGIPADVLPRIFNAFEQGSARITQQFGGLGLGLAISRALVELHGGAIHAKSPGENQGATFIIELPGPIASPAIAHPPASSTDTAGVAALRLLLVEDHADTARTLARLLRLAGFTVIVASDVASARLAVEKETFDLLVSDLGLPDGEGHEIMRMIRESRRVPGIAMSGYGMEEDLRRSAEAGFSEHLVKPVNIAQLIAAIRRIAENRLG